MIDKTISLDHVGPITHLTIPVPEGGGIVVLRGVNGSGKTHALDAVEALYSAAARKELRTQDGYPTGKVEGLGVTVRLGRSNTIKGELICESLDSRIDPSLLVDPGIKDPLAADAKRLATLIRLTGVQVPVQKWLGLVAEVDASIDVRSMIDTDPVATADRLRRRLHELALQEERLVEGKHAEASAIEKAVADVKPDEVSDPDALSRQLDEATQHHTRVMQSQADAVHARAKAETARQAWNDAEAGAANIAELEFDIDGMESDVNKSRLRCQQLETDLRAEKEKYNSVFAKCANEKLRLEDAKKHALSLVGLKETIDKVLTVTEPTPEAMSAASDAKAKAMSAAQRGEVVRRANAEREKAKKINAQADQMDGKAKRLRSLARSTDNVLEQALIDGGFVDIKVHDGRLCVSSDRGLEPFSDLSTGERYKIALSLAARGLPTGSVLSVVQEAWEALDPDSQDYVNKLARELGLAIVTAECTRGELRAEVYG